MADSVSDSIDIEASAEEIFAVATDLERSEDLEFHPDASAVTVPPDRSAAACVSRWRSSAPAWCASG